MIPLVESSLQQIKDIKDEQHITDVWFVPAHIDPNNLP